jgi:hypothetical protein
LPFVELQRSAQQLNIAKEKIERKIREITCGHEGSEKKVNCQDSDVMEGKNYFCKLGQVRLAIVIDERTGRVDGIRGWSNIAFH